MKTLLGERGRLRIVLWGDSISEVGRSERWHGGASSPQRNWGALVASGIVDAFGGDVRVEPVFAGIGGQNAYEGLGRIDQLFALSPDLLLIAFGTNDCCHHRLLPEQTARAIDEMVERIQAADADAVLLGTGGGSADDASFEHVDATNNAIRRVAQQRSVPFVDICDAILRATDDRRRWGAFHLDAQNCHPNDAGHRVWADAVLSTVLSVLKS